jgi:hypothetical protein
MKNIEIYRDRGQIDIRELNEFEQLIGYRLPQTYKDLLSKHNALYPRDRNFKFIDRSSGKPNSRDITFHGFGDLLPEGQRIANAQDHDVYGHEGLVTFGMSANGDYICFDYQHDPRTDEPKIVVMFHDYADENKKMLVNFVADSFEEFMGSLY